MACYELNFTIPIPGISTTFIEFSPDGRFLAVGDRASSSLYILDRLAGFHPIISAATPAKPTALVWETSKTFYAGLNNGHFIHYRIDLRNNELVKGADNDASHGRFPITAIALDAESKTLVLSVGPEVIAFRRIRATNQFRRVANISNRFNFASDPGSPAPPLPRSIWFAPNNTLVVTFCRQNIASIVLEFDGDSRLRSSFETAKIDYSGLPLLKAITSASGAQLPRCWVYGGAYQADNITFPFLFIDGGAATLSGSALGAAVVRDTITQREMQLLEHTVAHRCISAIAYHVANNRYSIATADRGENSTVKIWTARRPSSYPQSSSRYRFLSRMGWIITLVLALVIAMQAERRPSINEVSQFCSVAVLALMKLCIKVGYIILDAAEDAVLDAENILV